MDAAVSPHAATAPDPGVPLALLSRLRRKASLVMSTAIAAFLGLLPHVLHHAGPFAGAALFAGVGGSLLFGALGLLAAIPFLLKLHRRTGAWRVPAGVLVLFATMFSLSSFVIGPAISGGDESDATAPSERPAQSAPPTGSAHDQHH